MSEESKIESKPKKQSVVEMEEEMTRLELESKRLEVEEKKANLQDLRERLDERELGRETKRQRSITNGSTLRQLAAIDASNQSRCNHKKGGNGAEGIIGGKGDDSQFAILKHTFSNGDKWVRCLRCGKTWKPPLREQYKTEALFDLAESQYKEALEFQTRNGESGGFIFQFSDGGKKYREAMANTTLR